MTGCSNEKKETVALSVYEELSGHYQDVNSRNKELSNSYWALKNSNDTLNQDYKKTSEQYEEISKKLDGNEYKEQQQSLKNNINDLKKDKKKVEEEIDSAKKELSNIKGKIFKETGKPISYPAGRLYVGTDVKAGRYKIYDGYSNFQAYIDDDIEVNIILSNDPADDFGVTEYIYDFTDGEIIEADSPFKLQLIK